MGRRVSIRKVSEKTHITWSCGAERIVYNEKQKVINYKLHWKKCEHCRFVNGNKYSNYIDTDKEKYYENKLIGNRNFDAHKAALGFKNDK